MTPDCIVNKIVAEFKKLEREIPKRDPDDRPQSNSQWTKEILTTLCKLGRRDLGCTVWATGNYPNRVPDECRDGDEFLYDASWRRSDTCDRIISVPMVAECEWGVRKKVEEDFQKLLLARSKVRVMVYDSGPANDSRSDRQFIRDQLYKHVEAFNGTKDDTYLLIAYLHVRGEERDFKFKFHQTTYRGPDQKPECREL